MQISEQTAADLITPRRVALSEMDLTDATKRVEIALVGSLTRMACAEAAQTLELFAPDDLAHPRLRVIIELIASAVEGNHDPSCAVVFALARTSGRVPNSQLRELDFLLADAEAAAVPVRSAGFLVKSVTEGSVRRRIVTASTRLAQAAEQSAWHSLAEVVAHECSALTAAVSRLSTEAAT